MRRAALLIAALCAAVASGVQAQEVTARQLRFRDAPGVLIVDAPPNWRPSLVGGDISVAAVQDGQDVIACSGGVMPSKDALLRDVGDVVEYVRANPGMALAALLQSNEPNLLATRPFAAPGGGASVMLEAEVRSASGVKMLTLISFRSIDAKSVGVVVCATFPQASAPPAVIDQARAMLMTARPG